MSQAPVRAESYDGDLAYVEGFRVLHDQVDAGVSWSGHERNAAFLNLGQPTRDTHVPVFAEVAAAIGFDFSDDSRALASLDWDQDGDLDLVMTNRTGPRLRLLHNTTNDPRDPLSESRTSQNASRETTPDGGNPNEPSMSLESDRDRGQFVTLRLRGTASHRDAIGARVVISLRTDNQTSQLMRTVYAGHGFLSQSSKTLHFGLDPGAALQEVTVRWPNGQLERIEGVQPNAHWTVVEGSGRAEVVPQGSSYVRLEGSDQTPMPPSEETAVVLVDRIPLPYLRYRQGEGEQAQDFQLAPPFERPILLNLWATWCRPCLAELKDLANHKGELDAAGVDVLVLNLDELQPGSGDQQPSPSQVLKQMDFPFVSGTMPSRLMRVLETAHNSIFLRPHQLPIPLSLLLDRKGRVAAVYRGPVNIENLIRDTKALSRSGSSWRQYSQPFEGRWMDHPRKTAFLPIVTNLLEEDLLLEASELLILQAPAFQGEPDYPSVLMICGTRALKAKEFQMAGSLLKRAVELQPNLAEAQNNLAMVYRSYGNSPVAIHHLRKAIAAKPDYIDARLNLASLLVAKGELPEALQHVDVVLETSPDHKPAIYFAATVNLQLRKLAPARELFERVVALDPNHVQSLVKLGQVCQMMGQWKNAIAYYQQALKVDPKLEAVKQIIQQLQQQHSSAELGNPQRSAPASN